LLSPDVIFQSYNVPNVIGWGSAPDHAEGAYTVPPDPLAGFKGSTCNEKGGEGRVREEWNRDRRGTEGRGVWGTIPPLAHPPSGSQFDTLQKSFSRFTPPVAISG